MDGRVREILSLGRLGRETDRARTTVELAINYTDEVGDLVFNSCHWLAGMLREGKGIAYHVLDNFEVTQSQIDRAITTGERHAVAEFQIDPDVHALLNAAFAAASEMSHSYIGTEHLLIGATADDTKSALLLAELGLIPREVENEVFCLLGHRLH